MTIRIPSNSGWLLIAFGGGLVLIVGVRLIAPSLGGATIAAVLAVVVVAGLGTCYYRDDKRDRGRAGDDLYYLGLLFTLCSLIHTLVALFGADAGATPSRIEQLIGNFGIALVSTVAGILGRILLQSSERPPDAATGSRSRQSWLPPRLQPDERPRDAASAPAASPPSMPVEPEQDAGPTVPPATIDGAALAHANQDATEQMLALRRQLREASDAFAHFTRVTLDHGMQVKAHTEQLTDNFNQRIEAAARQGLDDTAAIWKAAAESMANATGRMLRQIDEHTVNAAHRTETTWEQVAAKSASAADAARTRLDEDAEQMATLLERLATANRALESLGVGVATLHVNVVELGDKTAQAATRVSQQSVATTQAQNALASGARQVQATAAQALGETAQKIAELRDGLTEQAQLWQAAAQDFATATAAEREHQAVVGSTVRQALDELAASAAGARAEFATLAALGETMKTAVAELAAIVAQAQQDLRIERERSQRGRLLASLRSRLLSRWQRRGEAES